jgi:hypothetical protein
MKRCSLLEVSCAPLFTACDVSWAASVLGVHGTSVTAAGLSPGETCAAQIEHAIEELRVEHAAFASICDEGRTSSYRYVHLALASFAVSNALDALVSFSQRLQTQARGETLQNVLTGLVDEGHRRADAFLPLANSLGALSTNELRLSGERVFEVARTYLETVKTIVAAL